jgi:hypothetical protein
MGVKILPFVEKDNPSSQMVIQAADTSEVHETRGLRAGSMVK